MPTNEASFSGAVRFDPNTGNTGDGTPYAHFVVEQQNGERKTQVRIQTWGDPANQAAGLKVGDNVLVTGELTRNVRKVGDEWDDKGIEIRASSIKVAGGTVAAAAQASGGDETLPF